jgi:hypothetical protein
MKKILVLVLLIYSSIKIDAQVISKEVINKFPPGVITKVYDIAKFTSLNDSQQLAIAREFENAENLLVGDLKQAKLPEEIDKAQQLSQAKIYLLIGKGIIEYTAKKSDGFAKAVSSGEVKYIQQVYNIDTGFASKFRNLQRNKYKRLYQQYLLYCFNKEKLHDKIAEISQFFDSAAFTLYPILHSGKFLNNYISQIKNIKPSIADSTIGKIQNAFQVSTAKKVYIDYGQTMLDVMQHIYPDTAITAYFYKPVIERQARFLSSAEKYFLINEQHVLKNIFDSLYGLVIQKNYQQVLLEYTFGANTKWRDSVIKTSNLQYDSVIKSSLLRNGYLISSSQFAIALKYRAKLNLRSSLTDTLLQHAMYISTRNDSIKIAKPFAEPNFKSYEAKWLNILLSEEQYTMLLTLKNSSQAHLIADEDWGNMEIWKITNGFNKEATVKELYAYRLAELNICNRLAHDKIKQHANLKVLKEAEPRALKILAVTKNQLGNSTSPQVKW